MVERSQLAFDIDFEDKDDTIDRIERAPVLEDVRNCLDYIAVYFGEDKAAECVAKIAACEKYYEHTGKRVRWLSENIVYNGPVKEFLEDKDTVKGLLRYNFQPAWFKFAL